MTIVTKGRGSSYSLEDYKINLLNLRVTFDNGRHGTGYGSLPNHCQIQSPQPLTANQWVHIVATLDSAGIGRLWVNGSLSATDTILPLLAPATEPVRIGQGRLASTPTFNGAMVQTFSGIIDDVRVYSRALSGTEVEQLYPYETLPQPCMPHAATAIAQVLNGFVVGAVVADPGCGYTNVPLVRVVGGGGTGAAAHAVLSGGLVTGINITNAGIGYTNTPIIKIASPPFVPWLEIGVSRVRVTLHVVLGNHYVLESSSDVRNWVQVGDVFTAEDEAITQEFDVDSTGKYFKLRQVP